METFSALLAFVRGIHRSPMNSPHKGQCHGALMFFFIYVWINDWVNNREAGDLRPFHAHRDVTVMSSLCRLTRNKSSNLRITGPLWGTPLVPSGFPSQRASYAETFPCHDVIMTWWNRLNCSRHRHILARTCPDLWIQINSIHELKINWTSIFVNNLVSIVSKFLDFVDRHVPPTSHTILYSEECLLDVP